MQVPHSFGPRTDISRQGLGSIMIKPTLVYSAKPGISVTYLLIYPISLRAAACTKGYFLPVPIDVVRLLPEASPSVILDTSICRLHHSILKTDDSQTDFQIQHAISQKKALSVSNNVLRKQHHQLSP